MKYIIDYGNGIANLYTPSENWKGCFYKMAMPNPKIRKQVIHKKVKLIGMENNNTDKIMKTEYERLECGEHITIVNKLGVRLKCE